MKTLQMSIAMIIAMLFSMPAWACDDDHQSDPRAMVEKTITDLLHVLKQRKDQSKISIQDRADIRQIIEGRFDYKTMSKYSMGRPWKKLNKAERLHFTSVFRDYMEYAYGNRLRAYKGQTVTFSDATVDKKKTYVKSTVKDGNKSTVIIYRVHETKTGWQIRDVNIAGVSMVNTFNQDFKGKLSKKDGYKLLVTSLEKIVAKFKAKDKGTELKAKDKD